MSLMPNATYANPTTPFFGGAGPAPTQTLTSPASVIAGGGSLDANLALNPNAGGDAALLLNGPNGTASITMVYGAPAPSRYTIAASYATGDLTVVAGQSPQSLVSIAGGTSTVLLGDGNTTGLVAATSGTVQLDASLVGTVPTGGVLTLNNTGGTLSASTNTGITVSSTQTTIVGNYKYVVSLGTVSNAVPVTITSPTQTGLYSITIGGASADATGIFCQVSVLAYFLVGSGFVSGGNGCQLISGAENDFARLFTSNGVSGPVINFQYVSPSPASISGLSARVVQLTGDLGF